MTRMSRVLIVLALLAVLPIAAEAWDRGRAERFVTLPDGAAHPEGITADDDGNLYVATFEATKPAGTPGEFFVYSPSGRLLRRVTVAGSDSKLLDLAFHPTTGALLVIDFGNARLLSVNPFTGANTVFTQLPPGSGPNVMTFDKLGNVYVSDSFHGTIWRTGPAGGPPANWKTDPLLAPSGVPPFGANGLAFNAAQSILFVANTSTDLIVQIAVQPGYVAGAATEFTNSVNGADGLIIDEHDNLWIASNQADEIVVVDPTGKAIAKLGDFDGLDRQGRPVNLLFPASLVFSRGFLYVTNLGLDLRLFGHNTVDAQWAAAVARHTVSRLRAVIPPVRGDDD